MLMPAGAPVAASRARTRRRLLAALGLLVGLAALCWAAWSWLIDTGRVSTDNAYVSVEVAQVTPLISGAVREVRVVDSQPVRRGDVLVVLDDADQRLAVALAGAALAQAGQRFRQAQGGESAARGKLTARTADVAQARARLAEAQAGLERAKTDLDRREALARNGFVSREQLANARIAVRMARASQDAAAAAVQGAYGTAESAGGDLRSSEALVEGGAPATSPDVAAARARLAQAQLELERTVIRASVDGVVARRQVQVGQRISAGTPVMALVPLDAAYVEANFKESQLVGVRLGQPALLTSDFYGSGAVFHGRVAGFSAGTGAAFALIPPQNASGNWIKVVQRLPVRIKLDPSELAARPLRAGLSMEVTIDTRR